MPIRWDTLLARHAARALARSLAGARLRAVRLDQSGRDLMLLFRERTLVWRLHPTRGWLRLHRAVEPADGDHRYKCVLLDVEAPPDERLIRLRFTPTRAGPFSVAVELMSTRWNAIVTEGDTDTIRHLLWRSAKDERLVVGQAYGPPPSTGRRRPPDTELVDWMEALQGLPPAERRGALVRGFAWTSPLNAAALLGGDAGTDDDLVAGFELWRRLADPEARDEPVVLDLDRGPQPYPFPLPGQPSRRSESLLAAFEACARGQDELADGSAAAVLGPELLAHLERSVGQAARRVTSLEVELAELPDPSELRAVGDLILARYREIPSGAVSATLLGFDGEPVTVELDPAEPAHANASSYYDRAGKSERAAERLPDLLERARAELDRLEELVERVRAGEAGEEDVVEAIGPMTQGSGRDTQAPALPYRTFRSSGGLEIRVGRGAKHNDDLTFHHSAPNDVWLHARHTAGAHVVLRWQGPGNPPARDLMEAATLAALHSKARTSGSVPVDWTLRKYVRKPRKSPPGKVALERAETLFVEPDEALMERLREGEDVG